MNTPAQSWLRAPLFATGPARVGLRRAGIGLLVAGAIAVLPACGTNEDVDEPAGSIFGTTAMVDNSSVQNAPAQSIDVAPVPGDTTGMGTTP
jgi:hypothetical protein